MTTKPPTVLVIADEPSLREFVVYFLEPLGYGVECVEPADSLSRIAGGGIDVVLLDMGWPETSGLELCMNIRAQAPAAHLPVLALTELPVEACDVTGFAIGPDEYLTKPFEIETLRATIARHCSPQG
jgi:DNA-binding response OmpR family regulator